MRGDGNEREQSAGSADPAGRGGPTRARCTRHQALGEVSKGAGAGAAMVAGGWAMHRWASRKPNVAAAHVKGAHAKRDGARSPGDSA